MKFSEYYPSPVPVHEKWSNFIAATLEQNFNSLQKTITYIGQDLQAFLPKYITLSAGETLLAGDLCYLDSNGTMSKADASTPATSKTLIGIADTAIASGAPGRFLIQGIWTTSGLTTGDILYIHTVAGQWTNSSPGSSGEVVRILGYALSPTQFFFDPDRTWTEIA